jgi:DNA topoisomerase I
MPFNVLDPLACAAQENGLRYVSDDAPGIRRRRRGRHFAYVGPDGRPVKDAATLDRIRKLAVPPAYEDVWICPDPRGHIQATGRDARRRKQYRYHPRWREVRDENKYARMLDFAKALPRIRRRVAADLRRKGLEREKVLAAVVALLEITAVRVGNDEYARANQSFGLTTLRNRHARVRGNKLTFRFRGKSGVQHEIGVIDHRLAKIVRECQDLPDQQLFDYVGDDGDVHRVVSSDVNAYIREISGGDFTAKDFRTWMGTVRCAVTLSQMAAAETATDRKRNTVEAVREVARHLGNTPAVCRKCYVHPEVLAAYMDEGKLDQITATKSGTRGWRPEERFVIELLKRRSDPKRLSRLLKRSLRERTRRDPAAA